MGDMGQAMTVILRPKPRDTVSWWASAERENFTAEAIKRLGKETSRDPKVFRRIDAVALGIEPS